MSMKNPLTPAGIEPATFRFVAQHLNHCATAVPKYDNTTPITTMNNNNNNNNNNNRAGNRNASGLECLVPANYLTKSLYRGGINFMKPRRRTENFSPQKSIKNNKESRCLKIQPSAR